MLLQVKDLNVVLGGLQILQGVTFHVNKGELVVIVGSNGAGKSTTLRSICGMNPIVSGSVVFDGNDVTGINPNACSEIGLCMVPEGRQLFPEISARENLLMGAYHYRKDKKRVMDNLAKCYEMFPVLERNKNRIASTFSGGEQQMISIARGLMSEPKIMMIDEMSLGLAPIIIADLFDKIKELNQTGMSILLIEQNARQALAIADRAYVLENGTVTMDGTGQELLHDEQVKSAYLGL